MKITIAHSPDSDDAFMFYALATDKIDPGDFEITHKLDDIETLNQRALEGEYEVTAVSIHGYAYLWDRYVLLNTGASMGEGYGPIVVSGTRFPPEDLERKTVGIPGEHTSAYLALRLLNRGFVRQIVPFDRIIPAVKNREVDAGVIIHEGQLTYRADGLHKVIDLGEWWKKETGLPLPLGGNVIRRDLGEDNVARIAQLIHESIAYALAHKEEALSYALQFGRGLDAQQGDQFVGMYVNERTLDYGEEGRAAVRLFLERGYQEGLIPHQVEVEFVG